MKISKPLFDQFSERFSYHPHEFFTSSSIAHARQGSLDEWEASKCPYQWIKVEEARGYQAWIDIGYGNMALAFKDKIIGVGCQSGVVVPDDGKYQVVFMDKEYFGIPSYLYFSNSSQEKKS